MSPLTKSPASSTDASAEDQPATASVSSLADDAMVVFRGFCMGAADVVPGVSGGTVALILGIYRRLVTAISHFDVTLVRTVRAGRWKEAARHVDLRFLMTLAVGIAGGFLLMTLVVNRLLNDEATRPLLLAAFFGMILASTVLVGRMIHYRDLWQLLQCMALGVVGAALAFWLMSLAKTSHEPSLLFLFFCGLVAACAMILPGISGAMLLLILGVYGYLTDIPHQLLHGENVVHCLLVVVVFGAGCAVSLVSVSKVLRWLLAQHQMQTMSVMCGLMLGALIKLWPFQENLTPGEPFKEATLRPIWPAAWGGPEFAAVGILVLSVVAVLAVDWWMRRLGASPAAVDSKAD